MPKNIFDPSVQVLNELDGTEWMYGVKAGQDSRTQTDAIPGLVFTQGGIVTLTSFGVTEANATEDNATRIANAIAATPEGGTLLGPGFEVYTGLVTIDKRINVLLPGGLKRHPSYSASGSLAQLVVISAISAGGTGTTQ